MCEKCIKRCRYAEFDLALYRLDGIVKLLESVKEEELDDILKYSIQRIKEAANKIK